MGFALAAHTLEVVHIRASLSIAIEGYNHSLAAAFLVTSSEASRMPCSPEVSRKLMAAQKLRVARKLEVVRILEVLRNRMASLEAWHHNLVIGLEVPRNLAIGLEVPHNLVADLEVGHHSRVIRLVVTAHIHRSPKVIDGLATIAQASAAVATWLPLIARIHSFVDHDSSCNH